MQCPQTKLATHLTQNVNNFLCLTKNSRNKFQQKKKNKGSKFAYI